MVRFAGLALGVALAAWPWLGEAQSYPPTKLGLQRLVATDAAILPGPEAAVLWKKYRDWEKGDGVTCTGSCYPAAKDMIADIQAHVFRTNGFVIDQVEWSDKVPAYVDDDSGGEVPDRRPVKLSYIYPQIVSPKSVIADRFNEDLVEYSDQLWNSLGGPPPSTPDDDMMQDVALDYAQNVDPLPGVISITFNWGTYPHGAVHGVFGARDFNWNIGQRRVLQIGDLFDLKTDWKHGLAAAGLVAFQKESPFYFRNVDADELVASFCDPDVWAVTAAGLRIDTQAYEVGGYAAGAPSAVVPWAVLRPYLRRGGLGLGG